MSRPIPQPPRPDSPQEAEIRKAFDALTQEQRNTLRAQCGISDKDFATICRLPDKRKANWLAKASAAASKPAVAAVEDAPVKTKTKKE